MMTDIEIAQSTPMKHILEIAQAAGIDEKYVELYGRYKAKLDLNLLRDTDKPDGKLILVTAITPTPASVISANLPPDIFSRVPCHWDLRPPDALPAGRACCLFAPGFAAVVFFGVFSDI